MIQKLVLLLIVCCVIRQPGQIKLRFPAAADSRKILLNFLVVCRCRWWRWEQFDWHTYSEVTWYIRLFWRNEACIVSLISATDFFDYLQYASAVWSVSGYFILSHPACSCLLMAFRVWLKWSVLVPNSAMSDFWTVTFIFPAPWLTTVDLWASISYSPWRLFLECIWAGFVFALKSCIDSPVLGVCVHCPSTFKILIYSEDRSFVWYGHS